MKRVAIYTRRSKPEEFEDEDVPAVERQRKDCEAYAKLRGWEVLDKRYDDNGYSAFKNVERPHWKTLMADVRAGRVDAVLVWKLDRAHRRLVEAAQTAELLKTHKAFMVGVVDGIDTSTIGGEMMFKLMSVLAEWEPQQQSMRLKRTELEAAREGKRHRGGNRMFGFTEDGLRHNKKEAAIIVDLVDRLLSGDAMSRIVKDLDRDGVRGAGTKKKGADGKKHLVRGPFTVSSLKYILKSPALAGVRGYNPDPGSDRFDGLLIYMNAEWEPIIDFSRWVRVIKLFQYDLVPTGDRDPDAPTYRMVRTGQVGRGRVTVPEASLLAGLLVSSKSGDGLVKGKRKPKQLYVCRNPRDGTAIGAEDLDRYVAGFVKDLVVGGHIVGGGPSMTDLEAARREVLERQTNLLQMMMSGEWSREAVEAANVELAAQLRAAEAAIQAAQAKLSVSLMDEMLSTDDWWDQATVVERREVVRAHVKRIVVKPADRQFSRAPWFERVMSRVEIEWHDHVDVDRLSAEYLRHFDDVEGVHDYGSDS